MQKLFFTIALFCTFLATIQEAYSLITAQQLEEVVTKIKNKKKEDMQEVITVLETFASCFKTKPSCKDCDADISRKVRGLIESFSLRDPEFLKEYGFNSERIRIIEEAHKQYYSPCLKDSPSSDPEFCEVDSVPSKEAQAIEKMASLPNPSNLPNFGPVESLVLRGFFPFSYDSIRLKAKECDDLLPEVLKLEDEIENAKSNLEKERRKKSPDDFTIGHLNILIKNKKAAHVDAYNRRADCVYEYNALQNRRMTLSDKAHKAQLIEHFNSLSTRAMSVKIPSSNGVKLDGVWVEQKKYPQGHTVVLFHGNGQTWESLTTAINFYRSQGLNVLATTMRGYPGSEGSSWNAREQGIYDDTVANLDFLIKEKGIDRNKILVHGYSIGGTYASVAGSLGYPVILDKTFSSAQAVANNLAKKYTKIPVLAPVISAAVKSVFKDGLNNVEKIKAMAKSSNAKEVLVLDHPKDEMMSSKFGEELTIARYQKVNPERYFHISNEQTVGKMNSVPIIDPNYPIPTEPLKDNSDYHTPAYESLEGQAVIANFLKEIGFKQKTSR